MYFTLERTKRILSELNIYIYKERQNIEAYKMKQCGYGDYEVIKEDSTQWEEYRLGQRWGGKDQHCWFKTEVTIPKNFKEKVVVFEVRTGREGGWDATNPQFLVYVNGKVVQGLDVNHREIVLSDFAAEGEKYNIDLYAYSGMEEGYLELNTSIATLDKEVEKLYYNIKVPVEVAELLDEGDKKRIDILNYMNEAINLLDLRQPFSESFYNSVNASNAYLEEEFYNKYCGNEDVIEVCVGHTHIDVAWLWSLAQTREKSARSFSTVLNLMKQYPEYIFMSSQPQLYKYIKEDCPEIFDEIKNRVKEGKWEPEGAMWLESDCNLTSGESLVRQIMFGTRFFRNEFGVENKILWLPDVFGYSAALPQILRKSGIDYFMTTKISWNEYNKMPYDSFMWKGIDGTEVLTHFISTRDYEKTQGKLGWTTYNGQINSSQVMGCWQRYQHKDLTNEVLNCFGYGDGGGGPTKEMLENGRRLAKGIPGSPKVKMGTALDFFKRLDNKTKGNKKLPKWVGELYLEYHRGTYTSMARNKKYNRKTEFLNLDSELFATMNNALNVTKCYPAEELNKCWEITLLNQFHDIIPGSSIKEVYDDSKEQYEEINSIGRNIVNSSIKQISSNINLQELSVVVFNPLSFTRSDIVEFSLPEGWTNAKVFDGEKQLQSQLVTGNKVIFFAQDVPSKGYKSFKLSKTDNSDCQNNQRQNVDQINNQYFNIKLDEKGNITSIFDKFNERELIKAGERANVIQAFEDKPHNFDAWDINIYYQEKMWEVDNVQSIEIVESGDVRTALKVVRKFLDSTIEQTMYIYNDIPRIDFSNWIDWKEKQILLKSAFPVDVHADKATYEIQYGNVERPTHWNTSWDYARFEVCAHKWADLSEGGYGIGLLNDCKYGHDIKDSVMRLTLLKSAVEPNVDADREEHSFTYSLYPHAGGWKEGNVVPMAYRLNCPMYAKVEEAHEGILPNELSLIKVDKDNVIIEVVKKAEESDDIIVRMYECYNTRTKVNCTFLKSIDLVTECDLMERNLNEVIFGENSFEFEIKPYEIKTYKLKLK